MGSHELRREAEGEPFRCGDERLLDRLGMAGGFGKQGGLDLVRQAMERPVRIPWIVLAEPVAPPIPWSKAYLNKTGKTAEELNAKVVKRIPAKEDVKAPVYPGAFYYQSNNGIGDKLISVVLVSRDEPGKVRAWYKEHSSSRSNIKVEPFTLYEWMTKMMDIGDMKSEIWISVGK